MSDKSVTSFAALLQQQGSDAKCKIRAKTNVEGAGADTIIWVGIPLADLDQQARPGTGQHRGLGFALRAEVDLPGKGVIALRSNWVSIVVP